MSEYNWVVFRGSPTSATTKVPTVSIQRHGALRLNRTAYESLGRPSYVSILIDLQRKAVGIRPAAERIAHSYRIRQEGTFLISAKAFCRAIGLLGQRIDFEATLDDGVLTFHLDQGIQVAAR